MAECIVGDITPHSNISKEDKHKLENEAMEKICSKLTKTQSQMLSELYSEYESQTSPTAKFVKDLDRLEMCSQAREYQELHGINLEEFFTSCRGKFHFKESEQIFEKL